MSGKTVAPKKPAAGSGKTLDRAPPKAAPKATASKPKAAATPKVPAGKPKPKAAATAPKVPAPKPKVTASAKASMARPAGAKAAVAINGKSKAIGKPGAAPKADASSTKKGKAAVAAAADDEAAEQPAKKKTPVNRRRRARAQIIACQENVDQFLYKNRFARQVRNILRGPGFVQHMRKKTIVTKDAEGNETKTSSVEPHPWIVPAPVMYTLQEHVEHDVHSMLQNATELLCLDKTMVTQRKKFAMVDEETGEVIGNKFDYVKVPVVRKTLDVQHVEMLINNFKRARAGDLTLFPVAIAADKERPPSDVAAVSPPPSETALADGDDSAAPMDEAEDGAAAAAGDA